MAIEGLMAPSPIVVRVTMVEGWFVAWVGDDFVGRFSDEAMAHAVADRWLRGRMDTPERKALPNGKRRMPSAF